MSAHQNLARGMYAYPWDFIDEGIDTVLDAIQGRGGLDTVYVTTWYHSGMFFLPHNPNRKVHFPEPGALYFEPSGWHGDSELTPAVSKLHDDWGAFWKELRAACDARGMQLSAWMPVLHNTGLGSRHPERTVTNAWGDPIIHSLCASHTEVQDVVTNVVRDVANLGVFDRILLESIEYLPLQHGFHHEVIGLPIDPEVAFATSLCFCSACQARGEGIGIDVEGLKRWVRDATQPAFDGKPHQIPSSLEAFREIQAGAMGRYLDLRAESLTNVLRLSGETLPNDGPRLAILDFGPLYPLGQFDGVWQSGVDLAAQGALVDEIHPTFYFDDLGVLENKVRAYKDALHHTDAVVVPTLRAIAPQVDGPASLDAQVAAVSGLGDGMSFYNYSFMRLETLDWIRTSVQERLS